MAFRTLRSSRSNFPGRSGGERRKTLWSRSGMIESVITTGDTAVTLFTFTSAFVAAQAPFTIVRTRGIIMLSSDQITSSETQEVAFGISKVSQQAIDIGVTAVPTPIADADSDMFFVYESLAARMLIGATNPGVAAPAGVLRQVDSKAMRKVEDGENIAAVVETDTNSDGVLVIVQFSLLLKLH